MEEDSIKLGPDLLDDFFVASPNAVEAAGRGSAATPPTDAPPHHARRTRLVSDAGSPRHRLAQLGEIVAAVPVVKPGGSSERITEAARAGDAGRGLAVVAEEIRSLADRCAKANARHSAAAAFINKPLNRKMRAEAVTKFFDGGSEWN